MIKVRRRFLTLFEVLLVMTMLTVAVGSIGINVTRAIQEQHFKSEVELFVDQLRLAQDLMLVCHGNIHLILVNPADNSGIESRLNSELPLPKECAKSLSNRELKFKHLRIVDFEDQLTFGKDKEKSNELDLKFLSNGNVMSQGVIKFSSSQTLSPKSFQRFVALAGYPMTINSFATLEEAQALLEQNETFNKQLTQHIFDEIKEKELQDPV